MAGQEKKYDIGHGITITDKGHSLRAEWKVGEHGLHSIGCVRPVKLGDTLEVVFSRDGKFYYLQTFGLLVRAWMGVETFESEGAAKNSHGDGVCGASGYIFKEPDGSAYFRRTLDFAFWDVKSGETKQLPKDDPLVQDYLGIAQDESRKSEAKFNESIAFSGRTLADILSKIGDYVVEPESDPVRI